MSKGTPAPTNPKDCPHFGQELPPGWRCPPCPLAEACFEAYENPAAFTFPNRIPPPTSGTTPTTQSSTSHAQLSGG